jgi:hypothetical protein
MRNRKWARGGIPPSPDRCDRARSFFTFSACKADQLFLTQRPREMNTLSRREEDALLKATKARALKECDAVVKGMYACLNPAIS